MGTTQQPSPKSLVQHFADYTAEIHSSLGAALDAGLVNVTLDHSCPMMMDMLRDMKAIMCVLDCCSSWLIKALHFREQIEQGCPLHRLAL